MLESGLNLNEESISDFLQNIPTSILPVCSVFDYSACIHKMKQCRTLTLLGVRRTLEEDLKLERKALDAFKDFITKELDRVSFKCALETCLFG